MLKPLFGCLNEMVSGPCRRNVKIVLDTPNFYFFPLLSRSIENLDHSIYDLKDVIINFTLALIEGEIPEAERILAKNLPVAIIEELIVKLIKKMYVREQLKNGAAYLKGNEHIIQFYREEKFKLIVGERKYKKAKRIADAKAEAAGNKSNLDKA